MAIKAKFVKTLPGTRGKEVIVCECHATLVEQYKWYVLKTGYAARTVRNPKRMVYMHRVIAAVPDKKVVDHINGDILFNACWNLRIVSQEQNIANARNWRHNTSGSRGVAWHKQQKCWRAYINIKGKQISLGLYKEKEDAIKARTTAEEKYWGEHRFDNRPKPE